MSLLQDLREKNPLSEEDIELLQALHILTS